MRGLVTINTQLQRSVQLLLQSPCTGPDHAEKAPEIEGRPKLHEQTRKKSRLSGFLMQFGMTSIPPTPRRPTPSFITAKPLDLQMT